MNQDKSNLLGCEIYSPRFFIRAITVGILLQLGLQAVNPTQASALSGVLVTGTGSLQYSNIGGVFPDTLEAIDEDLTVGTTCPTQATFSGPTSGPGGEFLISGGLPASSVTVAPAAPDADVNGNCYFYSTPITANDLVGSFTVQASLVNIPGSVDFSLANDGIGAISGTPQTVRVGQALSDSLEVEIYSQGAPVDGAVVVFSAPASGASGVFSTTNTSSATASTNISGLAVAPTFLANQTSGTYQIIASTSSVSEPGTSFSITNSSAGVASSISIISGNNQSEVVAGTFPVPLSVEVVDSNLLPVQGSAVTFTVIEGLNPPQGSGETSTSSNGASANFEGAGTTASVTTNSQGQASSPAIVAGTVSGNFTVLATTPGVSSSVTFSLQILPGTPYFISPGAGVSQTTPIGTDFSVPLSVTVTDQFHNPVSNVAVSFQGPSSGPGGDFTSARRTQESVVTNSNGVGSSSIFEANNLTGGYIVVASILGVSPPATFALVNQSLQAASAVLGILAAPVSASAPTPDGQGYWLVGSDGGVFSFGDANFFGSAAPYHPRAPIVAIAPTPDGQGYWLVGSDGGVFSFGDANFFGSAAGQSLASPIVSIVSNKAIPGYILVESNGSTLAF